MFAQGISEGLKVKVADLGRCGACIGLALLSVVSSAQGPEAEGEAEMAQSPLPTIVVIGSSGEDRQRQPAANTVITSEELRLQQPRSTEEALRNVPGVSIKPEEETAIVANIGIRGLS